MGVFLFVFGGGGGVVVSFLLLFCSVFCSRDGTCFLQYDIHLSVNHPEVGFMGGIMLQEFLSWGNYFCQ